MPPPLRLPARLYRMAAGRKNGRQSGRKRGRLQRVPRPVSSAGTVAVIRRTLDAGNLARLVADSGYQFGTVPSSLLDWGSLQAMWGRYRLLSVTNHFILSGEFDTTPAYPTMFVYHDFVSSGAPASLAEAMLKQGVKQLNFGANCPKRSFTYHPMVWTSTGFQTQVPAASARYQTATAFAPTFTSCGAWGLNYNSAVGSPTIRLLQEMTLEFSLPL